MKPQISIVILNYNTPELTAACVQSLVAYTTDINYEIILLDNGSLPASKHYFDRVLKDMPHLHIYYSPVNYGFGGGNNRGYAHSKGDYIFFLNSDTVVYENTVKILYDHYTALEKTTKVGFLEPRLYHNQERTIQQIGGNKAPTLFMAFVCNVPGMKHVFKKKYDDFRYADRDRKNDREVGSSGGPAFVVSRACFEHIGRFDERFFLYMEEFDLNMRLKKHGYHNFYTVKTSIIHFENQSPKRKRKKMMISLGSLIKFFIKYI